MENMKSELLEYILSNFYEGNRHTFLIRLAGTFAKLGVRKEVLIDIYNRYLRKIDDEDRVRLIERTYDRLERGLPIVSLDYSDHIYVSKLLGIKSEYVGASYRTIRTNSDNGFSFLNVSKLSEYVVPLDKEKHRLHYKYILYKRRLPESVFDKWKFYVSVHELDRICFVNFIDESQSAVDVILGRSIFDRYPKYKVLYGSTSRVLWNFKPSVFKRVLVEGVFDVMTVESYISGVNAVALLGKSINKYKLSLLRNSEEVTIMLDSDVKEEEIENIAKYLYKYTSVFVCKLPNGKDPSDLSRDIADVFSERVLICKGGIEYV